MHSTINKIQTITLNTLHEIWPYVEKIGVPILAFITGVSFFSLNSYWRTCANLRQLEKYIVANKSVKGYSKKSLPSVGLFDIIYSFKPISKFQAEFLDYKIFQELLNTIITFRKFYKIAFPIIIILAIIGITINEAATAPSRGTLSKIKPRIPYVGKERYKHLR